MKIYKKKDATPREMVDVIHITGRGMCIMMSRTIHGKVPELGETIQFDDELYVVTGLDACWKLLSPPILGDGVGLIVRKLEADELRIREEQTKQINEMTNQEIDSLILHDAISQGQSDD